MKILKKILLLSLIFCLGLGGCAFSENSEKTKPKKADEISERDADGCFSIAVIPDTQSEQNFKNRTEWLAQNRDMLDLRAVIHTGDVVNWGDADESQLVAADEAMAPLDNIDINVGIALGNHDTAAVGVGGSAAVPGDTPTRVRDTSAFNKYFPSSRYPYLVPMEEGYIDNAYSLFSAGGADWMILTLELWPRSYVIDWANEVVAAHPNHNVLIATHSYLTGGGEIMGNNGGYGANSPQYLYDSLISRHKNIKMVFSGHEGDSAVRVDYGEKGNKIVSILGCFHRSYENPVRLLNIDVQNGTIEGRIYCPIDGTEWTSYAVREADMEFIKS